MAEDSLPLIGALGGQRSSEIGGTAPPADVEDDALEEADELAELPPGTYSHATPSESPSRPLGSLGSSSRTSWASVWLSKSEQSRSRKEGTGACSRGAEPSHPRVPSPMPSPRSASLHCW